MSSYEDVDTISYGDEEETLLPERPAFVLKGKQSRIEIPHSRSSQKTFEFGSGGALGEPLELHASDFQGRTIETNAEALFPEEDAEYERLVKYLDLAETEVFRIRSVNDYVLGRTIECLGYKIQAPARPTETERDFPIENLRCWRDGDWDGISTVGSCVAAGTLNDEHVHHIQAGWLASFKAVEPQGCTLVDSPPFSSIKRKMLIQRGSRRNAATATEPRRIVYAPWLGDGPRGSKAQRENTFPGIADHRRGWSICTPKRVRCNRLCSVCGPPSDAQKDVPQMEANDRRKAVPADGGPARSFPRSDFAGFSHKVPGSYCTGPCSIRERATMSDLKNLLSIDGRAALGALQRFAFRHFGTRRCPLLRRDDRETYHRRLAWYLACPRWGVSAPARQANNL